MSKTTQSPDIFNLVHIFGAKAFINPHDAGQKLCREARDDGYTPITLKEAETIAARNAGDLTTYDTYAGNSMVAKKAAPFMQ